MSNTMQYVQEILTSNIRNYPDYTLGLSTESPHRPGAQFPQGLESMGQLVSAGHFSVLPPTPINGLYGVIPIPVPHFEEPTFIYMPRAEMFDSDISAWHALFHESAHLQHSRHPREWNISPYVMPPIRESIAEIAAYSAMRAVGLPAQRDRSAAYAAEWLTTEAGTQLSELSQQFQEFTATLAQELVVWYTRATETPTYAIQT